MGIKTLEACFLMESRYVRLRRTLEAVLHILKGRRRSGSLIDHYLCKMKRLDIKVI